MFIANVMLSPASKIQIGDVILTGNMDRPSYYTVAEVKQLTVCIEIVCHPYRRFVKQPHDGMWIIPHASKGAAS